MTEQQLEQLRYPIGRFSYPAHVSDASFDHSIAAIAQLPGLLHQTVQLLSNDQLNTAYRPNGWTLRQVVHHMADSHTNAYIRCKLAATEDQPHIAPYEETLWANTPDAHIDIAPSLAILSGLHLRWTSLLRSLSATNRQRCYYHPQQDCLVSIAQQTSMYAWHGQHHVQHIAGLMQRMGW